MPVYSKRIKDLPSSERPLEKLLQYGPEKLSDKELLALLIGSGRKGKNALDLAGLLLKHKDVSSLLLMPMIELSERQGIGNMKAAKITAALELGRRIYQKPLLSRVIISSAQDIVSCCREIANKTQEYCIVLYLNARHELLEKEVLAIGTLNTMHLEPREIFRHALKLPCTEIIICHNHPSGNSTPSEDDVAFTQQVQQGGEVMGIQLFDHVIVTERDYFSFCDSPKIKKVKKE